MLQVPKVLANSAWLHDMKDKLRQEKQNDRVFQSMTVNQQNIELSRAAHFDAVNLLKNHSVQKKKAAHLRKNGDELEKLIEEKVAELKSMLLAVVYCDVLYIVMCCRTHTHTHTHTQTHTHIHTHTYTHT